MLFAAKDGEALYNQQKKRPGTDCDLDHDLFIARVILILNKVGKALGLSSMT